MEITKEVEPFYKILIEDLKQNDIERFLEKDSNFIRRIYEIIDYLLKNKSFPPSDLTFQCDNLLMYSWINNNKRRKEKIFSDLNLFVNCFKKKSNWNKKFDLYYDFIVKNGRKPKRNELIFDDKTDGFNWFRTQSYILSGKAKNGCRPLNKEQKEKIQAVSLLILNIKMQSLYDTFCKLKRFPRIGECFFDDGLDMLIFIKKIEKGEIVLPDNLKILFDKLLYFDLRIKSDGIKSEIKYKVVKGKYQVVESDRIKNAYFSSLINVKTVGFLFKEKTCGFYLRYLRKFLNLNILKMSKLLGLSRDNYAHIECNNYSLTDFHQMQILNILEEIKEKDKVLNEMYTNINIGFMDKPIIEFLSFKLITYLSLNLEDRNELEKNFYYRYRNLWGRGKHKNLKNRIDFYNGLDQLKKSDNNILNLVEKLQYFLRIDILNTYSKKEIMNITNIVLGRKCSNTPSIYMMNNEDAEKLLKELEEYKILHDFDEIQTDYYERCCYLLSCVIEPGKDLAYEVYRYKVRCGFSKKDLAALFEIDANLLSSAISNGKLTKSMEDKIIKYIYLTSFEIENEDFIRLKKSFLGDLVLDKNLIK